MAELQQVNTKSIVEMSQIGAPLTGDFEEVLLHDPNSIHYQEHLSMLVKEIQDEVDLDNMAYLLQKEALLLEKYEEQELADKRAYEAEKQKKRNQDNSDGSERVEHQLTPTKIVNPGVKLRNLLMEFSRVGLQVSRTHQDLQQVQEAQHAIQAQWQHQQAEQADQFVQAVNGMPVLLPNGARMPVGAALSFDPSSVEAVELKQRLQAAPMMPDILNTLESSAMRAIYDKQVEIQQLKLRVSQPDLAADDVALELAAKQQAVYDLKLDLRQLQNKFILSVAAIHGYMKRQGENYLIDLVDQYNLALGIDASLSPHKRIGVYKILENTITPYLAPRLTMENRNRNVKDMDQGDLQIQAIKVAIQKDRLQQQHLSQLSTFRALIASLRHVASENPQFDFLHDLCDRVGMQPQLRNNKFRPVPKGYIK